VVRRSLRARIRDGRRWQAIEADAFELPKILGDNAGRHRGFLQRPHEIYSYVPYPATRRECGSVRLEAVRDLLKAAYHTLVPGGRTRAPSPTARIP